MLTTFPFASFQHLNTLPALGSLAVIVTVSPTMSLPPPMPPTTSTSTFTSFAIASVLSSCPFSSKCLWQKAQSLCPFTPSASSVAGISSIHGPNLCAFCITSLLSSVIGFVASESSNFNSQPLHL